MKWLGFDEPVLFYSSCTRHSPVINFTILRTHRSKGLGSLLTSVVYTGLKHLHSQYYSGGFPRISAASAFSPSPKRGTESLDCGKRGKWRAITPHSTAHINRPRSIDHYTTLKASNVHYCFSFLKTGVSSNLCRVIVCCFRENSVHFNNQV